MATVTATEKYAANPVTLPEGTLVDLFFHPIDRFPRPDAQMYRSSSGWERISHAQLLDDVRAFAAALEAKGIRRGDRVALLSENRPEWAHTDYALLSLGALTVPIYGTLPPNQIAFILKDSGARAIIVSNSDQLAKILGIASALPELQFMVVMDAPEQLPARVHSWKEMLEAGRANRPDEKVFRQRALEAAKPHDTATLIYTSGTTADPKGVMLTHNNLFSNVLAQAWMTEGGTDTVALSFLPLSHVFQRLVDYCIYYNGGAIVYVASFDGVGAAMREVKPTIVCAVPRVYEKLYEKIMAAKGIKRRLVLWARDVALAWAEYKLGGREPPAALRLQHSLLDGLVYKKLRDTLGGRLRFFMSGGAPLNPTLARFFYGAGVMIYEGYGLTETSPVTNLNRPGAFRVGTVGKPVSNTEIKIAEDGEILIRGPQVMKGYFNNPDATAQAIDPDGWFHTGDIGDIDEDQYLRITDRKKELIVTAGGKNIAPQPIQNLVKQSPFVGDALLVGDKRPFPIMIVVPNFTFLERWAATEGIRWSNRGELVTQPKVQAKYESEVKERLHELARYEMPKKLFLMEREFDIEKGEITPKLSVKRRVVETNFSKEIEALYHGSGGGE